MIMARCGCSTVCACAVTAGGGITVSGNGGSETPYIVETDIGTGDDASCLEVMACVCSNLGDGLACDTNTLRADISSDSPNQLVFGDDNALYVPPTSVTAGSTVSITGTGTTADPYVISAASDIGDTAVSAGDGIAISGTGVSEDPYVIATDPYVVRAYGSLGIQIPVAANVVTQLPIEVVQRSYPDSAWTVDGSGYLVCPKAGLYWAYVGASFRLTSGTANVRLLVGERLQISTANVTAGSTSLAEQNSLVEIDEGSLVSVQGRLTVAGSFYTPVVALAWFAPLPAEGTRLLAENDPVAEFRARFDGMV